VLRISETVILLFFGIPNVEMGGMTAENAFVDE